MIVLVIGLQLEFHLLRVHCLPPDLPIRVCQRILRVPLGACCLGPGPGAPAPLRPSFVARAPARPRPHVPPRTLICHWLLVSAPLSARLHREDAWASGQHG